MRWLGHVLSSAWTNYYGDHLESANRVDRRPLGGEPSSPGLNNYISPGARCNTLNTTDRSGDDWFYRGRRGHKKLHVTWLVIKWRDMTCLIRCVSHDMHPGHRDQMNNSDSQAGMASNMRKIVWFFLLISLTFSNGSDPQPEQIHLSSTGKEMKLSDWKKEYFSLLFIVKCLSVRWLPRVIRNIVLTERELQNET